MNGCLVWFAAETKTREKSEGGQCGYFPPAQKKTNNGYKRATNCSKKSHVVTKGFFRVGRPLESGNKDSDPSTAFRSCAHKLMAYLLDLAGHHKGNGIRPHSLKVTTISAIMKEVIKEMLIPPIIDPMKLQVGRCPGRG